MVLKQSIFEAWVAETGQQNIHLLEKVLSEEERSRGWQFHRQELREQHVVAHALKRLCIAKWLGGIDPRELRFAALASGKPILLDTPVEFNLSHTRGVCAVVLSNLGPCGVDIEAREAGRHLSPALLETMTVSEQGRILASGDPYGAFVERWVVKEAFAKFTGLGLAERFDTLCTEHMFDEDGAEFGSFRDAHLWRKQFGRYCIAVCVAVARDGAWRGNIHAASEDGFGGLTASGYEFIGVQGRANISLAATNGGPQ